MFKKGVISLAVLVVVSLSALLWSCSSNKNAVVAPQNSEARFGYLFNQDGSPAKDARVTIVPADFVPGKSLAKNNAKAATRITDQNGRFVITNLSTGTYNIFGQGNGVASFAPSVLVDTAADSENLFKDTLKQTGSIKGVIRLSPQADSRIVLILVIGSNIVGWPDDSTGNFSINQLAPGSYKIRFLAMGSNYPILDTNFLVTGGKITDVGSVSLANSLGSDTIIVRDSLINGVWGPNKTYKIMNNVLISPGERLEIREGTHIVFMGNYDFTTNGNCIAKGTIDNPIIFTYGFNYTGQGWHWIGSFNMASTDSLVFNYCVFEHGFSIVHSTNDVIAQSYFEMKNCIMQHMIYGVMLWAESTDSSQSEANNQIVIEHSIFNDIGYSHSYWIPLPTIFISGNDTSMYAFWQCNHPAPKIKNNIFYNIQWASSSNPEIPDVCFFSDNCYYGITGQTIDPDDPVRKTGIFSDPKFVDVNNKDYHLAPDSPCRSAGTDGKDMGLEFK